MVVLLDLDGDDYSLDLLERRGEDGSFGPPPHWGRIGTRTGTKSRRQEGEETDVDRPNPNVNGFSAALNCYPLSMPSPG